MLDELLTEQLNPHTAEIDLLETEEALYRINDEDERVARAVRSEIPEIARAEDLASDGEASLREIAVTPTDVVCGIAASGRTPFVTGALRYARAVGSSTIGVVNTVPSEMETLCDVLIAPLVGPEAIGGSTR